MADLAKRGNVARVLSQIERGVRAERGPRQLDVIAGLLGVRLSDILRFSESWAMAIGTAPSSSSAERRTAWCSDEATEAGCGGLMPRCSGLSRPVFAAVQDDSGELYLSRCILGEEFRSRLI
jgi:hypothetical protein